MKHKVTVYLFFVLIAFSYNTTTINAQACATAERFETTTFARLTSGTAGTVAIASYSQNGWQGSGLGTIDRSTTSIYFSDNSNTQTFTNAVTNVNLKGTGATFSMSFAAFNGNSVSFPFEGNQSDLEIRYEGMLYATIATSNGSGTTNAGTISFANGAVNALNGLATPYTYNVTPIGGPTADMTLLVKLPGSIPNSGNFTMSFVPNANNVDPHTFSDDYNIYTASLLSCPIVYSGTILNDANGLTDNLVNGTAINTTTVSGLQVALYDGSGNIVPGTTTNINPDGTYSIAYSGTGTYTVRLLNLPSTYVNTGESSNGTGTTPDGAANGIVSSYTILDASTNTDKPNGNFGIEQPPQTAISTLASQPNPGGSNAITIPSMAFTTSTGANPNTGDAAPGVVNFIKITAFPANTTSIVIGGVPFTSLAAINTAYPNGIPTDVTGAPTVSVGVDPIDGAVTVLLQIAAVDNARVQDPTPGNITIPFSAPLPVTLISFEASVSSACKAKLQWQAGKEDNFSHYDIETSSDGVNFVYVDKVMAAGSGNKYVYEYNNAKEGKHFFRLILRDLDNQFEYSPVVMVYIDCEAKRNLKVYPTASNNKVTVEGIRKGEHIMLYDASGRRIFMGAANGEKERLDISRYAQGIYNVIILTDANEKLSFKILKQ